MEDVFKLIIKQDKDSFEIIGLIDYHNRIIKEIKLNEPTKKGHKIIKIIPFESLKSIEIKERVGCIGKEHELLDCKRDTII